MAKSHTLQEELGVYLIAHHMNMPVIEEASEESNVAYDWTPHIPLKSHKTADNAAMNPLFVELKEYLIAHEMWHGDENNGSLRDSCPKVTHQNEASELMGAETIIA